MTLLEVFMESKEIKKLIVERSTMYRMPLRYVCREAGIDYTDFMSMYINSGSWKKCNLTEDQFQKLLSIFGIEVRFQLVINKSIDLIIESKRLAEKYGN